MNGPFWITKYALSGGIEKIGAAKTGIREGVLLAKPRGHIFDAILYLGKNIFDNEADAKAAAEAMREKKIASLKKQIAKLEKVSFS